MIEVVAAVIRRGDRFLLALRPEHKHHGGLWEFPGGKLIQGESLETALRRELQEELALTSVDIGRVLRTLESESVRIHFLAVRSTEEPLCREHTAIAWCTKPELATMQLCPLDRRFSPSL